MTIWERKELEKAFKLDVANLPCLKCGEKVSFSWNKFRCKNHHNFSYIEYIAKFVNNQNVQNKSNVKWIFKEALNIDVEDDSLICFKCGQKVRFRDNMFICSNNHSNEIRKYMADYIDMLDGYAKIACDEEMRRIK